MIRQRVLAPFIIVWIAMAVACTLSTGTAHAASGVNTTPKALPTTGMLDSWTADLPVTSVAPNGTNTLCVVAAFSSSAPMDYTVQFSDRYSPRTSSSLRTLTTGPLGMQCWSTRDGLPSGAYNRLIIKNVGKIPYRKTAITGAFRMVSCWSNNGRCWN